MRKREGREIKKEKEERHKRGTKGKPIRKRERKE